MYVLGTVERRVGVYVHVCACACACVSVCMCRRLTALSVHHVQGIPLASVVFA